jgi:carboxymethylenebutenolidase
MTYPGTAKGPVRAYLATPANDSPSPGIIVVQEIMGLAPHIEDMARRVARAGYVALAPDLYSHDQVFSTLNHDDFGGPALSAAFSPESESVISKLPVEKQASVRAIVNWFKTRDQSTYLPDLKAAVTFLKGRPDTTAAVGVVGFCFDGGLAGRLAASGADLQAGVIYYGPIPPVDQVGEVRCPLLGHYGGEDPNITNTMPQLQAAMAANGKDFTAYVYEGAPHAFNNDTRPSYHAEAAITAWGRTLDFLQKNLQLSNVRAG